MLEQIGACWNMLKQVEAGCSMLEQVEAGRSIYRLNMLVTNRPLLLLASTCFNLLQPANC